MTVAKKKSKDDILLVHDDDYLRILLPLIKHAKKSIDIMAYSFAMASASGKVDQRGAPFQIAEALRDLKAKRPDVLIRLYVEGRRDTSLRNRVTAEVLKKEGVLKVKYGATHAKGVCVDGKYILFGSTNWTNQSIQKNHETNILTHRKEISNGFIEYYEHLWSGGKHGGIELDPPMYPDGTFEALLLEMISSAKKSLEFSIYFFDHKGIRDALIEASERGVKVRGFIHDHGSFALSYVHRTRRTVQAMQKAGIEDLHFAPKNLFTHSKYLIKDKKEIALGTGNWLPEDVHIHPQLYAHLKEPKLAKELSKHLSNVILRQSRRI